MNLFTFRENKSNKTRLIVNLELLLGLFQSWRETSGKVNGDAGFRRFHKVKSYFSLTQNKKVNSKKFNYLAELFVKGYSLSDIQS
jgi:hypothetical protein